MNKLGTAAVSAAAAVALSACGGGSSGDDIKSTITHYYTAFANGDGAGACSDLTKATRTQLEKSAGGRNCATAIAEASKNPTFARFKSKIKDAKVTGVKVNGNAATATVKLLGISAPVSLVKEGGAWKIQSSPGQG